MNSCVGEQVQVNVMGGLSSCGGEYEVWGVGGSMTFGDGKAKCGECGMKMEQKGEGVRDTDEKMEEGKDEEMILRRSLMNRKEEDCEWETLESHEQYFDGKYP